jgi:hypothetical protein
MNGNLINYLFETTGIFLTSSRLIGIRETIHFIHILRIDRDS